MPTKPSKKPKSIAPKAPPRPSVSISVTSAQTAPTTAPTKLQVKKRKHATKMSDKPPTAKKSKHRRVTKIHSLKSVATSEAEKVPTEEPWVADKDADYQKVLEESMKTAYALPRDPLPPVVIKKPESRKYQPLPEVPGKGKAKVTEEQVAHDRLSLQKPKKKSPAEQYILQRRISKPTGSSLHDDSPYAVLGQSDSKEESEKVVLGATMRGNDEDQAGPDPGAQAEGQKGPDAGTLNDGQAGSNPDEMSEGQAGPDPGNVGDEEQSIPSPVVHTGSNHEHMDLDVADVSPQPFTKQLDEGFTATVYPKVQENLKLAVEEQVFDKPSDAEKNKETKVESMVNVPIQQAVSSISLMTSHVIDLTSRLVSPKVRQQFKETTTDTTTTTTTTTTTLPPPPAQQQNNAEAMMVKRIGELEHIMANLIQMNKEMEERLDKHRARLFTLKQLDIPQQVSIAVSEVVTDARMWETESYKTHEDHKQLFEALEKSMNRDHSKELAQDLAEALKKKKKSRETPKTPPGSPSNQPPPPPLLAGPSGPSGAPRASGSSQAPPPPPLPSSTSQESPSKGSATPSPLKSATSAKYQAWTMNDIRLRPSISSTPAYLEMDEDMGPDEQAQSLENEDIESTHISEVNLRQGWWKPLEEERPAMPKPAWSIPSSDAPVPPNNWASALASSYSPLSEDSLLAQTDDMATFIDWFCKRQGITELKPQDLEGSTFEIIKVFHPDVIHLQYQMKECHKLLTDSVDDPILRNNVSTPLPLGGPPGQVTIQSNFFFNKDLDYLRYGSKGSRPALSISKMKAVYYPDAGLEQMLNLTKPQRDATGFEYKHDYTVIDSPRVVIFRDKYGVQMMMRFNEIHKFCDGTLQQIDEALDYRVKEFRINRMNPEAFEDKEDLSQPGELCWRTCQRGRLQTFEAYRMIKSFRHSRPLSDDLYICEILSNELTDAFGKPFKVLNNVFEHKVSGMKIERDELDVVFWIRSLGNIVTNSHQTPSWREIVSLTVLVKLASFT
uniref:Uncharacterized protein n=1 Tax=Tanacetum cinerariifolium TaxID=118510 RepID=A0A699HQV7_TANCI|nr:hypothetical protein [Tanacetum cinerariifolium]